MTSKIDSNLPPKLNPVFSGQNTVEEPTWPEKPPKTPFFVGKTLENGVFGDPENGPGSTT